MRVSEIITKKRDGLALSQAEIEYIITGYTHDEIPDYQISALLMAIVFRGMTAPEIAALTLAMANSGEQIDLSAINGIKIDKHSTGGVGDTTTLVVAPLVASCGVPIAKMSGRGLGHTGGTIDKLESIPGFKVERTQAEFIQQVNEIGLCLMGQSQEIAPADKKLYALRDVTATVESIPLIASSIMSKKIAAGADGFVLDVKFGKGAFMDTSEDATNLATTMVEIGKLVNKPTITMITSMNQPLGMMIGNALEMQEAIQTLAGEGPEDLIELCLELGSQMLVLAQRCVNTSEARKLLETQLNSGSGLKKLAEMIAYQGGNPEVVTDLSLLGNAGYQTEITSHKTGYIEEIDAHQIGELAMKLGAGRETKASIIDLNVGIELKAKCGDYLKQGQPLAIIHSNRELITEGTELQACYTFSPHIIARPQLIEKKISSFNV